MGRHKKKDKGRFTNVVKVHHNLKWKKKKYKVKKIVVDMTNVKESKFLGYCPKCTGIVGKNDKESKSIYICACCGHRARISTLKDKRGDEHLLPKSKKEYMESIVTHSEVAPSVDPEDLDVQE